MEEVLIKEFSLQSLFEQQGFIVLAYTDREELAREDASGITDGNIEGAMEGIRAHIVGPATEAEWLHQCNLCGDYPYNFDGLPYIGFRKVIVE